MTETDVHLAGSLLAQIGVGRAHRQSNPSESLRPPAPSHTLQPRVTRFRSAADLLPPLRQGMILPE